MSCQPKLVDVYFISGPQHALTLRSEGQRSWLQDYKVFCQCGCVCRYDCL